MRICFAMLGLALLLAASASAGPGQFARIAAVIDGDTIVLSNGEHVRLVQIDAPEMRDPPEC